MNFNSKQYTALAIFCSTTKVFRDMAGRHVFKIFISIENECNARTMLTSPAMATAKKQQHINFQCLACKLFISCDARINLSHRNILKYYAKKLHRFPECKLDVEFFTRKKKNLNYHKVM